MRIRCGGFNINLALAVALALVCGCKSSQSQGQKLVSAFRIHVEINRENTERNRVVPVYRANPLMVSIDRTPLLTEARVTEARVVDGVGGFAIRLQFDRQGTWLLESNSTANRGRRFAIFCEFNDLQNPKVVVGRWLAAPMITRITNGVLQFTPDATLEEAHQIVRGLNNVAKKLQSDSK
jgi:hypothetical protein